MKTVRALVVIGLALGGLPAITACTTENKCGSRPLFAKIGSKEVDFGACSGVLGAPIDSHPSNLPTLSLKVGDTVTVYAVLGPDASGLQSSDPSLAPTTPTGEATGRLGSFKAVQAGSSELTIDPTAACGRPVTSRCAIAVVTVTQ